MKPVTKSTIRVYSQLCRKVRDAELDAGTPFEDADRISKLAAAWATGMFQGNDITPRILAREVGRSKIFKQIANCEVESALKGIA